MFLVQGLIAIGKRFLPKPSEISITDSILVIGFITYLWIVDFPENSHNSFRFLTAEEQALAEARIADDRGDVKAENFPGRNASYTLQIQRSMASARYSSV
jgi:hypothetical protein